MRATLAAKRVAAHKKNGKPHRNGKRSKNFREILENLPSNIMMADRDLVIRYVNPAALKQLRQLETHLGTRAEAIQGSSLEIFFRNVPLPRDLLAGPNTLPLREFVTLGPETILLTLTAILNTAGTYLGLTVTLELVSGKLKADAKNAENAACWAAIGKSQAVISFDMYGAILTANDHFLSVMGYTLDEIKGKHHSLFVDEVHRSSSDYQEFWAKLNRGEYQTAEYKRIGKGGKEVWIHASYNPIFDPNGKPFKVVKCATDVTQKVKTSLEVTDISQFLASAAEELTATSQQMSANAEETSAQANVVSAASEQVNKNLQTVSAGTEQMGASIRDIAKNATEAAKIATSAVKLAERTNHTVSKLGDSSTEIGKVIEVITSIAQQTNLLALNATIEAARAGEAGKGFAVVANEVKELAKETAKATEDISRKIELIQTDTKGAVDAIASITAVINEVNSISSTIAAAVEQQNATTNEMARNLSEAAHGSGEIVHNIAGVAEAAQNTTRGAQDTQKAAAELARMATSLRDLVGRFKG